MVATMTKTKAGAGAGAGKAAGERKAAAGAKARDAKSPGAAGTRWAGRLQIMGEDVSPGGDMTASETRRWIERKAIAALRGYKGGALALSIDGPELPAPRPATA
jgi:hypothetical protein